VPKKLNWNKNVVYMIALVIIHAALFFRVFPPTLLLDNAVPLHVDTSRYFSSLVSAAGAGGLYGYDPYQMAGYPAGLWNSMGKKGFELARFILPCLSLERVFYLSLFFAACLGPLLAGSYLMRLFVTGGQKCLFMLLLLLFWHLETMVCYFWQVGNVFFPLGSLLLVCFVVMIGRLCFEPPRWHVALAAGFFGTFLFYTHTVLLVPAILVSAGIAGVAIYRKTFDVRRWVVCGGAAGVCLLLSLPWLLPLLASRGIAVPVPWPMFTGGIKNMIMDCFSDRVYLHHFDRQFLFHFAIVAGLAGGWLAWRDAQRGRLRFVMAGALVCLLITYGFPLLKLMPSIQPYRFRLTAVLFLLPLATVALSFFWGQWCQASRPIQCGAVLMLLIMLPSFSGYLLDMTCRQPTGSSRKFVEMFAKIRQLPGDGRLLVDDIPLGHLMPYYTGRAILGGLSTQAFVVHGFAGIDDRGVIFGKPAEAWTAEDLSLYLVRYAVEYLVLQRPELMALAEQHPGMFEFLWQEGSLKGFRFQPYAGYDLEGDALVKADYNEIVVTKGSSDRVALMFHWDGMLESKTQGFCIEPLAIAGLPVPFIRGRFFDGVEQAVIGVRFPPSFGH